MMIIDKLNLVTTYHDQTLRMYNLKDIGMIIMLINYVNKIKNLKKYIYM